jgi:sec-independent protein translocase protein TatC
MPAGGCGIRAALPVGLPFPSPSRPMPHPDEDELLDKTKMSFSEHLEELRKALWKSIVAIVLGTLVGLMFGWSVVNYIQGPLRDSLEKFYERQAELKLLEEFSNERESQGATQDNSEAAARSMAAEGLAPRYVYVDGEALRAACAELFPEIADGLPRPQGPDDAVRDDQIPHRDRLARLRVFVPIEEDSRMRVVGLSAQEPFMVYMKASIVAGILLSSPFVFYFIWEFVAAGLYRHERKYIYMYLPISLGLFLAGAALAFYVAFDYVLDFLFWFYEKMGIDPDMRLSEWISFVLILPLGFGISFQLPLVMLLLERIGVFTIEAYVSKWRIAVLVICTLSMFLTPADPGSMVVMAVPLVALYFLGVLMCRYMPGRSLASPPSPGDAKSSGS